MYGSMEVQFPRFNTVSRYDQIGPTLGYEPLTFGHEPLTLGQESFIGIIFLIFNYVWRGGDLIKNLFKNFVLYGQINAPNFDQFLNSIV